MAYSADILQMRVWGQLGKVFPRHGAHVEVVEKLGLLTSRTVSECARGGECHLNGTHRKLAYLELKVDVEKC